MTRTSIKWLLISCSLLVFFSCGAPSAPATTADSMAKDSSANTPAIITAEVLYTADSLQCRGFAAYDQHHQGKMPIVVVVHEWWGLTDYVKSRAKQLAELGYFAIDADMFGDGKTAATPAEAMAFARPYYLHPEITGSRLAAVIAKAKTFAQADSSKVAAIGYCFGGFVVLNAAKLGAPLKGTVSFHGDLSGITPKKGVIQGPILICQGAADVFVPEKAQLAFKKSMDSVGAKYTFISYAGATHAFTNPEATVNGKKFSMPIAYNAAADSASWKDMQLFFTSIFR